MLADTTTADAKSIEERIEEPNEAGHEELAGARDHVVRNVAVVATVAAVGALLLAAYLASQEYVIRLGAWTN